MNWVIYKEHFFQVLDARGIIDHINRTGMEPADPVPEEAHMLNGLSTEQAKLDEGWKKELREWKSGEAIAKQKIACTIPDSLFLKIHSKGTALAIWKALENHFQKQSQMVVIDPHRRIQNQCCGDKDDIVAHLATLSTLCTM